jgi:hypothetical protein
VSWKEYTLDAPILNRLNGKGKWDSLIEGGGEVDLTEEYSSFWKSGIRSVIDTGREYWDEMGR